MYNKNTLQGDKNMKKSIKTKMMSLVSIINLLVFISILTYLNQVAKPKNEENVLYLIRQNVETKGQEVNQWIEKRIVEYRTLAAIPAIRSMDVREITPIIEQVTNTYKLNDQTMETFSFIGKNGFCWINAEATENLIRYEDYTKIYESDKEFLIGSVVTNENNRDVVVFYYAIQGYSGKKESLICSAVPLVRIEEIVNTIQLYDSKSWIMDIDHNIITSSKDYIYDIYLDEATLSQIELEKYTTSSVLDVMGKKGPSKLILTPIQSYRDWYLVTLVEEATINSSIDLIFNGFILLMLVLLFMTYLIGRSITKSVLKPIAQLQDCMNEATHGNLKCYYPTHTNHDEIYELGTSFNTMIDELDHSMHQIKEKEEEKRIAELKVMQAQIKPHFLYNTLDNIKWMAKKSGADEVAQAITALSTYFRLSLSHGDEFVSLKQEFKHTKSYLDIQKMRYKEKLSYTIFLPTKLESLLITKIILQPIVENAIQHGIKNHTKNCTIEIRAEIQNDQLVLIVQDDGLGMNSNQLEELKENLMNPKYPHYGMRNILSRLKYAYPHAQLTIESQFQLGTIITIYIPLKEVNQHAL